MAAAIATGFPKQYHWGNHKVHLWRLTDYDDGETLAIGLGSNILTYFVNGVGDPGTQTAGGVHSIDTTGTIAFYPGTNALDFEVLVIER